MKLNDNEIKLAKLNNLQNDVYKMLVQNDIKDKKYDLNEELAIHRKAIKKILDTLGIEDTEFEEYNRVCESAKVEAKGRIGEQQNIEGSN